MMSKMSRFLVYCIIGCFITSMMTISYWNSSSSGTAKPQLLHRTESPHTVSTQNTGENGSSFQLIDEISTTVKFQEMGVIRNEDDAKKRKFGYERYSFNVLVSDRIGDRRELSDHRHELCREQTYSIDLPKASIIICYYNEAQSALIRMVNSILDRTPAEFIHEILLIDDFSDSGMLPTDLRTYADNHWPTDLVKMSRMESRHGLIRAKIAGAKMATGEVLVFLDSHCEVNIHWLEPLLNEIKQDPHRVVCPLIDIIDPDTFKYVKAPLCYGGFNWSLFFKWNYPDAAYVKDKMNYVRPLKSPTMAGGLFAIQKAYFHELGEYDSGMDIWGAENVEISFRIWMCGGSLYILPCSRVGHIFRKTRPYGSPNKTDTMALNSVRTARVWMDQYLERFYAERSHLRTMDVGDISSRVELRHKLQCKSFQWYLDNVYPQILDPGAEVQGIASNKKVAQVKRVVKIFSPLTQQCLCSNDEVPKKGSLVTLCQCDTALTEGTSPNTWQETNFGEFRLNTLLNQRYHLCLNADTMPRLVKCHLNFGFQEWKVNNLVGLMVGIGFVSGYSV